MSGEVSALGEWVAVCVTSWEAFLSAVSTPVTVFLLFCLIFDLRSILHLSLESMRYSGGEASPSESLGGLLRFLNEYGGFWSL